MGALLHMELACPLNPRNSISKKTKNPTTKIKIYN
jgi:hypothetical protein